MTEIEGTTVVVAALREVVEAVVVVGTVVIVGGIVDPGVRPEATAGVVVVLKGLFFLLRVKY